MVNVYIKSFNRPFYLDRCIRSVKFNVRGYGRIIVLDDGTLSAHLNIIRKTHPDVEIRSSGADDGKVEMLRREEFDEIARTYPSAQEFWVKEIAQDPQDYVIVIEDDVWFVDHIDLPTLVAAMRRDKAAICKFWWSSQQHAVRSRISAPIGPKIEYFSPPQLNMAHAGDIWIVAFALFLKDYWTACVSQAMRLADERSQLIEALSFAAAHPEMAFAKTARRAIHQGWMVPARSTPEYYDKGLIQHLYMDAMNEAWAAGELPPGLGYPYDFPVPEMEAVLRRRLPSDTVDIWKQWHAREIVYFYF